MSGADLSFTKEEIASRLSHIINAYEFAAVKSRRLSLWFLNGRPGENGFKRLSRTQQLLDAIRQPDVNDTEAAYRVAKFYLDESNESALRSRIVDGVEKLLGAAFGMAPYTIQAVQNVHAAAREAMDYDERRFKKINDFVTAHEHEYPQQLNLEPALEVSTERLISEFEKLLNQYRQTTESSSPWFFGGRPGQGGMQRLNRATTLLQDLRDGRKDMQDVKRFHEDESSNSFWNSRLLDGIERLLNNQGIVVNQQRANMRLNIIL